jgi:aspartate kinase
MVVLKFGGTSVADAQPIARAAANVARQEGERVVVTSALAGVTDRLLQAAALAREGRAQVAGAVLDGLAQRHRHIAASFESPLSSTFSSTIDTLHHDAAEILSRAGTERTIDAPALDRLLATGELMAGSLIAQALSRHGVPAVWVDPRQVMATSGDHGRATVHLRETADSVARHVTPLLREKQVVVTGGSVGSGPDGATTTLGRGGSDVTAAALGVCLGASEVQIWTHVNGVLTADPRIVPKAQTVPQLSFDNARDLACYGARVLHPGTLDVAMQGPVPVRVLSSRRPEAPDTRVSSEASSAGTPIALACRRALHAVMVTPRAGAASALLDDAATLVERLAPPPILVEATDGRVLAAFDDAMSAEDFAAALRDVGDAEAIPDAAALAVVVIGSHPGDVESDVAAALDGATVHGVGRPRGRQTLILLLDDADLPAAMNRVHDLFYAAQDHSARTSDEDRPPAATGASS